MSAGWELAPLRELLEVQNGYAFDAKKFTTENGVPLIRIRDLKEGNGTETNYTGQFDRDYLVNGGDLLIGMDGEFRCHEWKGPPSLLNQRVCRLRNFNGNLEPRFLYYGINKYLEEIEDATSYTTVKHLSSKTILGIEFPHPPLPEQQRIVGKLDAAFAALAEAQAHVERNRANARELFESYLNGLDAEKSALGNLVNITTGKLDANAAVENGRYPFFTCSKEISAIDTYAFDCEAILLAGNNAVGDFNVKHYTGRFNAYQRTYVITVNTKGRILYRFLYYQMLRSLKQFKEQSVGSGTKFLKLGMIKDMAISLPGLDEQKAMVAQIDAINETTRQLETTYQQKLTELAVLKKAVLGAAFRGEL